MLKLNEVLNQLDRKRLALFVGDLVLATYLLFVESQQTVLVQRVVNIFLDELNDGLLFTEAAGQDADDSDRHFGINEGLDVESAEVLQIAEGKCSIHSRVLADLDEKLKIKNIEDIALSFCGLQLPQ